MLEKYPVLFEVSKDKHVSKSEEGTENVSPVEDETEEDSYAKSDDL